MFRRKKEQAPAPVVDIKPEAKEPIGYIYPLDSKGFELIVDDLMIRVKWLSSVSVEYIPVENQGDAEALALRAEQDGALQALGLTQDGPLSEIDPESRSAIINKAILPGTVAVRVSCDRYGAQPFIDHYRSELSRLSV